MAHVFTEANFDQEVLQSNAPVLVDFWAEWCGPCRMMAPVIDELSQEIPEQKLKIGKLNVDQAGSLAMKYNVMSIPTFLVFQGGQVVDTIVGGMPKEAFVQKLQRYLA